MYSQVLVNNNLGGIALKQGRLEAALGYYQRAVRLLEQTGGSLWVLGALHLNIGHTYIRQHQLEQAADELQMAQAYFEQAQLRDLLPELYGLLAEVAWLQGDLETAEQHGQYSLELARELTMPREEGHNLAEEALVVCEDVFERLEARLDLTTVQQVRQTLASSNGHT